MAWVNPGFDPVGYESRVSMENKKINNKNFDVITYKNGKQFAFTELQGNYGYYEVKNNKFDGNFYWVQNGNLSITGQAKNNKLNGTLTEYEPGTGQIKRQIDYKNNLEHGQEKNFENGKLKSTTDWVKGLKTGSHITYDNEGKVISNDKYIANTPATDEEYKKWEKSRPKAKAKEELKRFGEWLIKPSTAILSLFAIVAIVAFPLSTGLLVVGGVGMYDFLNERTKTIQRENDFPERELNFSRKDLNEMKEELKHELRNQISKSKEEATKALKSEPTVAKEPAKKATKSPKATDAFDTKNIESAKQEVKKTASMDAVKQSILQGFKK
ncbi:toxin-antitoxin system YwqK family antitoxin [Mycoplasmopsis agalactiae]|uniref:CDS7 n=1 Tax=Mycoplasmopsis agalactiae TaxID=2110 RepID=D3VQC7_MYCAA|nr:hypothetical protein [Mycoplasmopsis agalactiae]KAB6718632.1 hypothetical protein E4L58_01870 [Mycoplasmopsis agalactiae]CAJ32611.1 CDS7 [Mycoplasmopsis agalactiae]CBH40521.1 CDS7 [Mycoplasmopsis agalactiae]CBH40703.1 CDS7 [Mycoplasmopsis agalactiae]CBH40905.1 CDS7 [Mycoplasmopsis agalactiae]